MGNRRGIIRKKGRAQKFRSKNFTVQAACRKSLELVPQISLFVFWVFASCLFKGGGFKHFPGSWSYSG